MNGVHDMGGMQGMGPIQYEKDEPVFHAGWEKRVFAMDRAMAAWLKWNIDAWRHDIETLPPADYLRFSYYEKWFTALEKRVVSYDLVTKDRAREFNRGLPSNKDPSTPPLFQVGQRVRARNINPPGHTRLPRYARGKTGLIVLDHGVYAFPDTNSQYLGEKRQHVYSVQFTAPELWGEGASPRDSIFVDMWDDYLERV